MAGAVDYRIEVYDDRRLLAGHLHRHNKTSHNKHSQALTRSDRVMHPQRTVELFFCSSSRTTFPVRRRRTGRPVLYTELSLRSIWLALHNEQIVMPAESPKGDQEHSIRLTVLYAKRRSPVPSSTIPSPYRRPCHLNRERWRIGTQKVPRRSDCMNSQRRGGGHIVVHYGRFRHRHAQAAIDFEETLRS